MTRAFNPKDVVTQATGCTNFYLNTSAMSSSQVTVIVYRENSVDNVAMREKDAHGFLFIGI
jgi:hypothetical protein